MSFKQVCKRIKDLKIQGARNVAEAGIKATELKDFSKKVILSLRPTEPALKNGIEYAEKYGVEKALNYFKETQDKINKSGYKKAKGVVFTHCHSSTVVNLLKYAKKKGKKFEVFNTETRPLYQGRKTAREVSKEGIKVTMVADVAAGIALRETKSMKKTNVIFFGADAVLKNGNVINKVGSGMFAEIAYGHKIPVYIVTQGWKFTNRPIKIEEREREEVWKKSPKSIKIKNPAFETINSKYITGIISEFGISKPKVFVKKVKAKYKWI